LVSGRGGLMGKVRSLLAGIWRRRRWLLTSAIALLFIGIVTFGAYWWLQHRAAAAAHYEYRRTYASYEAGVVTSEDVCAASRAACLTELSVPLSDPVRAYAIHMVHVQRMFILTSYYFDCIHYFR
jgi:hypothetical protein